MHTHNHPPPPPKYLKNAEFKKKTLPCIQVNTIQCFTYLPIRCIVDFLKQMGHTFESGEGLV